MKTLILPLLLLAPFASVAAADKCEELAQAVQHYEGLIQLKNIETVGSEGKRSTCDPAQVKKKILAVHQGLTPKQQEVLEAHACGSLGSIDALIGTKENELNLLKGLEKLKASIADNLALAKKQKEEKKALFAGLNFVDGVNAAQSLELLLQDNGKFLRSLQELDAAKRQNPKDVMDFIAAKCKSEKNSIGVCLRGNFRPNQTALDAINDLVNKGDVRNDDVIAGWSNALKITKEDGSEWSFSAIAKELKDKLGDISEGKLSLSKDQLKAVRSIEGFKDAGDISFASMKTDAKFFDLMQEYKFHTQDLQFRQQLEIQRSATLAFSEVKKHNDAMSSLGPGASGACANAKLSTSDALSCLEGLKNLNADVLPRTLKTQIDELHAASVVGSVHLKTLDDYLQHCGDPVVDQKFKDSGELSEACKREMEKVNARAADHSADLLVLNALKDEIAAQNVDEMRIRNLALSKLMADDTCKKTVAQSNLQCDVEESKLPKNLEALISDLGELVAFKTAEVSEEDMAWLCGEDSEVKAFKKNLICSTEVKKDPEVPKPKVVYQAPVTAPDGGHNSATADATLNGLGYLGGMVAGSLFQPKQQFNYWPPYNPYMYNYSPYASQYPMMSLSDEILFNARYYDSYGYYMPTLGLQPYSAFGNGISSYRPYPTAKSPYFR